MRNIERFIIAVPLCFTILVGWFSYNAYLSAPEIAEENLRGAGLSIAASIEQLVTVDPAFQSLIRYSTPDIAYFSIVNQKKIVRFHSNPALIGTASVESMPLAEGNSGIHEERKKLGTGEEIYLLQTTIHGVSDDFILNLALHTYRADRVISRAQAGVTVVVFLTISLWIIILVIMFLLRRDEKRKQELARKEELARLGELGAVMAHEIRNPLAGIKGFAQLVETAETVDQARLYADRIVTQSLRMESLVDDLLSFARAEGGKLQSTDLALLVRDCATIIRMETESATVELIQPSQIEVKVVAVSDRIFQMLLNLMKNGIQAMPDGGTLIVKLERIKSSAIITIRDSGIGITPENLPHIFEPFWTSKAKGTGLGLALCRKITEEHAGKLTVESSVGVGTTFTLRLPLEN